MKKLNKYKTFIFDLDNTLYDYSYCDKIACDAVAKWMSLHYNINHEDAIEIIDAGKLCVKSLIDNRNSSSHCRFLYFQKVAELLHSNKIIADTIEMYHIYSETFYTVMKPYDWVIDFFKSHSCCVCTNMIAEVQFTKLVRLGISEYVEHIVTSEEADAEKPNYPIYDLLTKKLSESNISIDECLFVGDNKEHDVDMPKKFGYDSTHIDQFVKELK